MNNIKYIEKLDNIIRSEEFKIRLKTGLENFPNLKLEGYIRNILVEMFNKEHRFGERRAFAEFPREKIGGRRVSVDFSICSESRTEFTMEMKYQFPRDFKDLNYSRVIDKDFCTRKYCDDGFVDAFLLVVCDWGHDLKNQLSFEKKWELNRLSQYQWKTQNIDWKTDLRSLLENVKNEVNGSRYVSSEKVTCQTADFSADFHFHFLVRTDTSQT